MNQTLEKCDCIFALGSYDTDVAQRGVELFNQKWAKVSTDWI